MLLIEKCKERRAETGLSNMKIAELSNIPLSTVNAFFAGVSKNPSLITAGAICSVLGVSLDGFFGIEHPGMNAEEIARVRAEYEENKVELHQKIESHKQNILLNEVTIANNEEIIRRQDLRMGNLEDRIKSQVFVINIFRVWILALHVYGLFMDSMVPDTGLIRGVDWGDARASGLMVLFAVILFVSLYFFVRWIAKKMWTKKKN